MVECLNEDLNETTMADRLTTKDLNGRSFNFESTLSLGSITFIHESKSDLLIWLTTKDQINQSTLFTYRS